MLTYSIWRALNSEIDLYSKLFFSKCASCSKNTKGFSDYFIFLSNFSFMSGIQKR